MVELLIGENEGKDPLDVLVEAGLPEAFLLTQERLDRPINSLVG